MLTNALWGDVKIKIHKVICQINSLKLEDPIFLLSNVQWLPDKLAGSSYASGKSSASS